MAIITTPYIDPPPGTPPPGRSITKTRLVKQDIVRQGITGWSNIIRQRSGRHDPKTPAQIACRAPMRFARPNWWAANQDIKDQWNLEHPLDFFCQAVARWIDGHSPAVSPYYPLDDPSDLTVVGTATAGANAMILKFTASHWYALWGIAIIRSQYPIVTPTWNMLRLIYPTTKDTEHTWLDTPLAAGVWHYRYAACEITGKLGAFSDDVFDTLL